jgi:predicted RNA-binding Zn-ribbon protein involved in translation (DUF1610 family)
MSTTLQMMYCTDCNERFHYDWGQINVTCPFCGKVQQPKVRAETLDSKKQEDLADRQCGDKRRFADFDTADRIRIDYETKHMTEMNVYRCGFCGFWHIGHKRPPKVKHPELQHIVIPDIDQAMTREEVEREDAALKVKMMAMQASITQYPEYTPLRKQMVNQLQAMQVRHLALKDHLEKLPRKEPDGKQLKARDVPTCYTDLPTDDLLNVFFQSAKEIGIRLRRYEREAVDKAVDGTCAPTA